MARTVAKCASLEFLACIFFVDTTNLLANFVARSVICDAATATRLLLLLALEFKLT
jgi:hypothetical protein